MMPGWPGEDGVGGSAGLWGRGGGGVGVEESGGVSEAAHDFFYLYGYE